jgi:hypothetical protein
MSHRTNAQTLLHLNLKCQWQHRAAKACNVARHSRCGQPTLAGYVPLYLIHYKPFALRAAQHNQRCSEKPWQQPNRPVWTSPPFRMLSKLELTVSAAH